MRLAVWALMGIGCAAPWGWGVDPSLGRETPVWRDTVIPWAKPLSGRTLNGLLVAPQFTLRDGIELGWRLDSRLDVVALPDGMYLDEAEDVSAAVALDYFRDRLKRAYEVIILGNFDVDALPGDIQAGLREAVKSGTGLVIVRFGEEWPAFAGELLDGLELSDPSLTVTRGLGQALVAEWSEGLDFARTFEGPSGERVVDIAYPGPPALTHCLVPAPSSLASVEYAFLETYFSLAARAVHWAAGRDPACRIAGIESVAPEGPPETDIPPFLPQEFVDHLGASAPAPPLRPLVVHFSEPAPERYSVRMRVRYPYRDIPDWQWSPPAPVRKGDVSYQLNAPMGHGDFFLDIWLEDRRGVVDWYTEAMHVDGWPSISDFQYPERVLQPNDSVPVMFRVRPNFHHGERALAYLRGTDSLGRVVAEKYVPLSAEGGLVETSLDFVDLIASHVRIEVYAAASEGAPLSRWQLERSGHVSAYLPVRRPPRTGFTVVAGGVDTPEFTARGFHRTLAGVGVDTIHTEGARTPVHGVHLENVSALPHVTSVFAESAQGGEERSPCLTDPDYWERQRRVLLEAVGMERGYGRGYYSLGRGNCLVANGDEVCRSATCLAGFRDALQAGHGHIDALNRAWEVHMDSWEAASRYVPSLEGWDSRAPWVDFRLYMDRVFANFHGFSHGVIREADPRARVGFVPLAEWGPGTGYDWWQLAGRLDWLAVSSERTLLAKVRSYQPSPGAGFVRVMPEDWGVPERLQWLPWQATLHQMGGIWIDEAYGNRYNRGTASVLTPDGRLTEEGLELFAAITPLRDGLGTLFMSARREHSGIAVYDSPASLLLAFAENRLPRTDEVETAFAELLTGLGYGWDFVSPEQVVGGALDGYAVLVLPSTLAMADDEVAAVRAFHERGGALLADIIPGVYDGHGARRDVPPLDRLFEAPAVVLDVFGDPGEPVGGDSALLMDPVANSAEHAVRGWLGAQGVEPLPGDLLRNAVDFDGERFLFQYGAARIAAFLADPHASKRRETVRVLFARDWHGHDLLSGEKVPSNRSAYPRLGRGEVAVYSALPYEVTRIALETPASVKAGRRLQFTVSVKAKDMLPGDHLVEVRIGLKGREALAHYTQTIACPGGQGSGYLPLAYNDIPGVYTLTARDMLTGMTVSEDVQVVGEAAP